MNCQNCNKDIPFGADYCNYCGEKIEDSVKAESYNNTIWGKIQHIIDKYETWTLGKITGHWIFKTLVVVLLVVATYLGFWGDTAKMKIASSDFYTTTYNSVSDEYHIKTKEDTFTLGLYIPKTADKIKYTGYKGKKATETKEFNPDECDIRINKGEYSVMTVELIDNGKIGQTIRFVVDDK